MIRYLESPTIIISEGPETNTLMSLVPNIDAVVLKLKSKDWEFGAKQHMMKWER
jgi:hypothetical protein